MEKLTVEKKYPPEYSYLDSVFSGASWIAPSSPVDVCVIRRTFLSDASPDSRLYVTGLGFYEVSVNGIPLSSDILIPPVSDYHKRDLSGATYTATDEMTHRIYYSEYGIGEILKKGENVIEITLGGGWYTQSERVAEGNMEYGDRPRSIYSIRSGEKIISSDGSETWRESVIRKSNLFLGEVIDYTFSDNSEKEVITLEHPEESLFTEEIGTRDKIIRRITPKIIKKDEGSCIFDLSENVSGLVSLRVDAKSGSKYTLRFSERINEKSELDFLSTGSQYVCSSGVKQIMTDVFITDGSERTFTPKFVWHAFRYFEVVGDIEHVLSAEALVIHADVPVTCEFESDSEGANFLFNAYIRTLLSNYHGSFPMDCPHRERLGYTGDGQLSARAAMMMTDSKRLYEKWILDILDGQDKYSGHVQHTAPFQGGGGGPGGWCSAVITVPYSYYKQYGFDKVVDNALPAMRRWIDFTASTIENGLIVKEKDGGWCLGDWCMKKSAALPETYVNTCWFIHAIRLYTKLLRNIGKPVDSEITRLEGECLSAVKLLYKDLSHIGAAMAYAAWIGIDTADACAGYYDRLGGFDTGFLGTDILMEVLFKSGHEDVAYKLLEADEEGSFLYMKRNGSTTIWERWGIGSSESHPMFGTSARQVFEGILGIRQDDDSSAFESVTISPALPSGMNYARGSILTPKGRISVSLKRSDSGVDVDLDIPESIKYKLIAK